MQVLRCGQKGSRPICLQSVSSAKEKLDFQEQEAIEELPPPLVPVLLPPKQGCSSR